jgi:hypothetical protein
MQTNYLVEDTHVVKMRTATRTMVASDAAPSRLNSTCERTVTAAVQTTPVNLHIVQTGK